MPSMTPRGGVPAERASRQSAFGTQAGPEVRAHIPPLAFIVRIFDPGGMARDRFRGNSARLVVASLSGAAQRHARWGEPTAEETAAAVAELREILAGRDDGPALLAEVAGVRLGFYEGELGEPRAKAVARSCIAAGADESLIPEWAEEGRRRAEAARLPPFSTPRRWKPPRSG
jgi:hypothetical protein